MGAQAAGNSTTNRSGSSSRRWLQHQRVQVLATVVQGTRRSLLLERLGVLMQLPLLLLVGMVVGRRLEVWMPPNARGLCP